MIGLKRGTVKLEQYNENWKGLFAIEKGILINLLKEYVVDVQHVGSTSIPGICAKPIIDILVGMKSFDSLDKCLEIMECNGYIYRKESGNEKRALFVKGEEGCRTHHIHFVEWNNEEWLSTLLFRDYLRCNNQAAEEYMKLKQELSMKYQNDRTSYTEQKNEFIQNILKKANI